MADLVIAALFVVGAGFILLAAVGVLRMPDLFLRLSCSSKASTLGVLACVGAAAWHFADGAVAARAGAGTVFLLVTAPVAAQVIGRAAYVLGVPLWRGTVDEMRGVHDRARGALR